jgi:hypothetical protein
MIRFALIWLLLCSVSLGQIKLQPEYSVGQPVVVEVQYPDAPEGALPSDLEWDVGDSGYKVLTASSIAVWPKFGLADSRFVVRCSGPLVTADGKYVPKSNRTFTASAIVRGIVDEPLPTPDPKPDDPKPPKPDGEAPIKEPGFRVLITYESQLPIPRWLNDSDFRSMLNNVCVAGPNGVKEWRVVDKDSPAVANAGVWPKALERTKAKPVPWLLISTGKVGFEGPLPESKADAMALIKRYAEAK